MANYRLLALSKDKMKSSTKNGLALCQLKALASQLQARGVGLPGPMFSVAKCPMKNQVRFPGR
jgi:hypothetical protein